MRRTIDDQIAAFVRYAAGSTSAGAAAGLRDTVDRLRSAGIPEAEITENAEVVALVAKLRASVPVPS